MKHICSLFGYLSMIVYEYDLIDFFSTLCVSVERTNELQAVSKSVDENMFVIYLNYSYVHFYEGTSFLCK